MMRNVIVVETAKSMDEACRALEESIAQHRFGLLHIHDVRPTLAKKGVVLDRDVRIYDVCNPQRAKQVLDQNMLVSAALPCAISVFEEGGKTKIAFLRPTVMLGLFESPELASAAAEVERTIEEIVHAAVR
jgi:uncharacterized protein (DUF302 family)